MPALGKRSAMRKPKVPVVSRGKRSAMRKPKDPVASKAAILGAAIGEFALRGYEGARIDAVARNTNTTRAMVYYYFKSKEKLYLAVLQNVYQGIREREKQLSLGHLPPDAAMRSLVSFTFDYYQENPNFVKIVVAENQAGGGSIRKLSEMPGINRSVVQLLQDVLRRGSELGMFRPRINAVDVHMLIASLGWFQIANRHTFGALFGRDFSAVKTRDRHKSLIVETIMRFVMADEHAQEDALSVRPRARKRVGSPRAIADATYRIKHKRHADNERNLE